MLQSRNSGNSKCVQRITESPETDRRSRDRDSVQFGIPRYPGPAPCHMVNEMELDKELEDRA